MTKNCYPKKYALGGKVGDGKGKGGALTTFSKKNPPKYQTELPDLRSMDTDDAVTIAKREPHLIPSGDRSEGAFLGGPRSVTNTRRLNKMRANIDSELDLEPRGGDWYDRYRAGQNEVTGGDTYRNEWNSKQHGQWSAGVSPDSELGYVLKETNASLAGMPTKAARPAQHEAHLRAIALSDPNEYQLGKKTGEYAKKVNPNLNAEPRATGVNDFRHARNLGYTEPDGSPQKNAMTDAQHVFADYETAHAVGRANDRMAGGRNDWSGEQLQAATWVRQKALDMMKKRPTLTYEQAFDLANRTIAEWFPKHTAYATYESLPGSTTGHLPALQAADQFTKDQYAQDPRSNWATAPGGRDAIYDGYELPNTAMAMRVRPTIDAQGIYTPEGTSKTEFNQGHAARPLVAFEAGPQGHTMPQADRALLDAAETLRAGLDGQNGGAYHKFQTAVKPGVAGSINVPMTRKLGPNEAGALAQFAKDRGYPDLVDTGEGFTMTDFRNEPTGAFARAALHKGKLQNDMREIVPDMGEPRRGKVDSNYLGLDEEWQQPHGSGAVSRKILATIGITPEIETMMDQNPHLAAAALARLERDRDWQGRMGDTVREDLQNLRQIVADGPGWVSRLKEGLASGAFVAGVAVPLLALAAYMATQGSAEDGSSQA